MSTLKISKHSDVPAALGGIIAGDESDNSDKRDGSDRRDERD